MKHPPDMRGSLKIIAKNFFDSVSMCELVIRPICGVRDSPHAYASKDFVNAQTSVLQKVRTT